MRKDTDLEFLQNCSHKDLDTLVQILIYDKDGKKRVSETLSDSKEYKKYFPKHAYYWNEICHEFQCYGGNTISNIFRGGKGVPYREILEDVCDLLKVKYNSTLSTEKIEELLLLSIFEESLEKMSDEERKELLKNFNHKTTDLSTPTIMAIVQTAIKTSGFASYRLSAIIANAVVKALTGRGLTLVGNQTLMKGISIMSGPIGWAITGGLTAIQLAGPAYRVTVPAVMEIIYLRRKCNQSLNKMRQFLDKIKMFFESLIFWR
jgi:uncharacterized protein YaaW (UPF0174 family)